MTISILLIVFIIIGGIFFSSGGLIPRAAEAAKGFERFLPGRYEKEISPEEAVPEEIKNIFDSLYEAFALCKEDNDCFSGYGTLEMKEYTIELEYVEEKKGTNMRLLNVKKQRVADHFVEGIMPCIAIPDKDDDIVAKYAKLERAEIKKRNAIYFGNTNPYYLFPKYPALYKPEGENLACFFTDDRVIDPETGKTYGVGYIPGLHGFDNNDMKTRTENGRECTKKYCQVMKDGKQICNIEEGCVNEKEPWASFDPPCVKAESLFCEGESSKGANCICDSSEGWTNKDNPWFSFEPPCTQFNLMLTEFAVDESLKEEKDKKDSDEGICIAYHALWNYFMIGKLNPSDKILRELARYGKKEGYIDKVEENVMETIEKTSAYGNWIVTRKQCSLTLIEAFRPHYAIFYDKLVDNIDEGCIDDMGYCASFDEAKDMFVGITPSVTREECVNIDKQYKHSFFVAEKGSKECKLILA
ncbi:hypothetical protein KY358_01410 [Candidatus Woesearchaeota archaeon]|nr:hypothetical protein [Candidatus Woesearchaeota archaeon]